MIYIEGADYFIRYVELPIHIGGCTCLNDDGTYDIYINSRLPSDKQWHAFLHEMGHILDDHFFRDDISEEEKEKRAEEFYRNGAI